VHKPSPVGGGASYLHLAAGEGQAEVCSALVELGIDINIDTAPGNAVPLQKAARHGHLGTVQWLLDHGARVDGQPTSGTTPLMAAAIEGHVDVVRLLLDAGAEINRDNLYSPQTALDLAIQYRVKQSGQDAVAALLRERGGIRPYYERHDWTGVPGQLHIECIERAIRLCVNPIPLAETHLPGGTAVTVRRTRVPKKPYEQLLFTIQHVRSRTELALCLPSAWPFNNGTMEDPRYTWPISLLLQLTAAMVQGGLELAHGDALDATHPALQGFSWPAAIRQWMVVLHGSIEAERALGRGIPRTLFLVPILTKKTFQGPEARAKANKLKSAKWKALTLPVEILQQESPPAPSEPKTESTTKRPSRTSKPKKSPKTKNPKARSSGRSAATTSKRRATSSKTKSTKKGSAAATKRRGTSSKAKSTKKDSTTATKRRATASKTKSTKKGSEKGARRKSK
jgi:hypothetical protein